jgi:hypothetical protein
MILVLRLVYVGAALLSTASGALVTASLYIAERAPQSPKFLGISLVVSAIYFGVGVVLLGIQRHAAATAAAVHGDVGGSSRRLDRHVTRLLAYLLVAGMFVGVVLALMAYGILARIDQGFAVFG